MRILIINYFYPPVVDAHAYRWEQIGRYWVEQGHQVNVISGRLTSVADHILQDGVAVTRVGMFARLAMVSSAPGSAFKNKQSPVKVFILRIFRRLYRKIYWPDGWWHWSLSAMQEVLRNEHRGYDLIISYSPCFGAHLAAALLKRNAHSGDSTWIADYGDPFSISSSMPPNNFRLYSRLNWLVEREVFRKAGAVVFTNQSTFDSYKVIAAPHENKLHVIPHLVDVQKLYADKNKISKRDRCAAITSNTIELLYVGGFHRGIREPEALFTLIRQLNRIEDRKYCLTIYGPTNGFDLSPDDCPQILYKGMVSRKKAMELIREADILVNVDNMNCVMSPSKIVEYIATGRPLLNLNAGGALHPALSKYLDNQFAFNVTKNEISYNNVDSVARFLSRMAGVVAPQDLVEKALEGYTLQNVANQYSALVLKSKLNKSSTMVD